MYIMVLVFFPSIFKITFDSRFSYFRISNEYMWNQANVTHCHRTTQQSAWNPWIEAPRERERERKKHTHAFLLNRNNSKWTRVRKDDDVAASVRAHLCVCVWDMFSVAKEDRDEKLINYIHVEPFIFNFHTNCLCVYVCHRMTVQKSWSLCFSVSRLHVVRLHMWNFIYGFSVPLSPLHRFNF